MKQSLKVLLLISLLLTFSHSSFSSNQPIKLVGDSAWEPFYGPNLPEGGFVMALVAAAFAESDSKVKIAYEPWSRALLSTLKGSHDAVVGAYFTEERANQFHYSEAFYTNEIILLSLKSKKVKYNGNLKSLTAYRIGIVQDNAYTPQFDNADYLHKEVVVHPIQNIQKLFLGRIDILVETKAIKAITLYLTNKHYPKRLPEIQILQPPLSQNELHLIVAKNNPHAQLILTHFNRGLKKILKSGQYKQILRRFLVSS
ncbi:substrate-binding periplasmic protein [Spartinivicinus ruber]|uniref:substrate-binding periplasmic protein n=1 Tax=Spartinivicinus ruber TaxID=2683272 RepID=UPI0013D28EDB|nr:transporter substrate-binding domain-containing protein [Spartinivicinus ruber]